MKESARCLCGYEIPEDGAGEGRRYDLDRIMELLAKKTVTPWYQTFFTFAMSLALFVAFGLFAWRVETLVAVVLALLVHEGGHLLAMAILGYHNLKILFIPLLGGVAMGDSDREKVADLAVITLSGPLIGLISAIITGSLYAKTGYPLLIYYTRMALFLNVLNLLPVYPLDGGRFFSDVLFSRSLKLEVAVKLVTGVAIFGAGIFMRELLLVLIGTIVALSLSVTVRMHKLTQAYRERFGSKAGEGGHEQVAYLAGELYERVPQIRKAKKIDKAMANQIRAILRKINGTQASRKEAGVLIAVYFIILITLPALAVMGTRQ